MKSHELGAASATCVNGASTAFKNAPAKDGVAGEGVHDAAGIQEMIPIVVITGQRVPIASAQPAREEIGEPADDSAASEGRKGIIGRDDRAHHLALGSGAATPGLRRPKAAKASALPSIIRRGRTTAVKRHSHADGEGRCGMNGYCDPWDENGCGGLYCGRRHELD